ncbi:argininosuccinate lyase [Rathayibacter sp. VKM Ac-2754]|uniref:argininosuccinate lyase n=1 Tax=Rathayibacter sp. VKM Ac-2754 TaxID=2609251 RepID=UPI0013572C29|nr:argininosuccinate lyase [Rathayibacter sp. VKM Ac-2754]MWV58014.1 argininosuccinate lyase [Rathayibacter sp. VKM Ac-2754]
MTSTDTPTDRLREHRFHGDAHELLVEINASIDIDVRLAAVDVRGSLAHLDMLRRSGILEEYEARVLSEGLRTIEEELRTQTFPVDRSLEDIHMNIESRLQTLVGPVAGKLHTARSRNDQVALDSRLWVRESTARIDQLLRGLIDALLDRAENEAASAMPGFTHLQVAQPVTIGHHLLAYAEMFQRDRDRFLCADARADESPLGAAALAGTGFPIDSAATAAALGFSRPMRNSIDAVSDRDFMLDFLAAAATLGIHLSRICEELVIWSTPQFGYVALPDGLTAGSSIMPQKRNPDAAELVRAKSGRLIGELVSLLVVMKGLPLAYSRDMQEDKSAVFDASDTVEICLRTMTAIIRGIAFDTARTRDDASRGGSLATELADWLVQERALPFREAHGIVGAAVQSLEARGLELRDADPALLVECSDRFRGLPASVLTVDSALRRRDSTGGTSPDRVRAAVTAFRALVAESPTRAPSGERRAR